MSGTVSTEQVEVGGRTLHLLEDSAVTQQCTGGCVWEAVGPSLSPPLCVCVCVCMYMCVCADACCWVC